MQPHLLSDPSPLDELSEPESESLLLSLSDESESLSSLLLLLSDPACKRHARYLSHHSRATGTFPPRFACILV